MLEWYFFFTVTIKDRFIASLLRAGLAIIRALVFLKPKVVALLSWLLLPTRLLWFLFLSFATPVYQALHVLRRRAGAAYQPAKNRLMYVVANRYTVHAMVAFVLLVAFGFNIHTSTVRAESFGQNSLMYSLASSEDERFYEEEISYDRLLRQSRQTYFDTYPLESVTYGLLPQDDMGAAVFATSSGVGAVQTSAAADSVAPRDEMITYAVQEGDTLSEIANRFGISLNTLLWANDLTARSSIRIGKELTILPTTGVLHTVSRGDTLSRIASKYDVDASEIAAFNGFSSEDALSVGTELVVPGGEVRAAVSTPSSVGRVFAPTTTSAPATPSAPGAGGGSARGTGSMVWPTDLRVITQYYGWSHTGIDIDCYFTNDNYAADAGTVVYSGWKGGYGYAVEVDHGGGMMTRYGHHASLYVSAGDTVSRGQALGRCGTTGRSTGTHLHFEVIVNGRFQNPLEYVR